MEQFVAGNIEHIAHRWACAATPLNTAKDCECETRDSFEARMGKFRREAVRSGMTEANSYLLHAVLSEIGGNSFDHNLGQWRDVPGTFFAWECHDRTMTVVLADRGQGVRTTLQRVAPDILTDDVALRRAFTERLSGRAPEQRGNGLKFVRTVLLEDGIDLLFQSGSAQYRIARGKEQWSATKESVTGCFAVVSCTLR